MAENRMYLGCAGCGAQLGLAKRNAVKDGYYIGSPDSFQANFSIFLELHKDCWQEDFEKIGPDSFFIDYEIEKKIR